MLDLFPMSLYNEFAVWNITVAALETTFSSISNANHSAQSAFSFNGNKEWNKLPANQMEIS